MPEPDHKLCSSPFVSLCLVALFGFGNIAVFYGFHPYLLSIGIAPFWAGWLLALEPLAALVLRPVISPWLGAGNALPVMRASLVLIGLALLAYPLAQTTPLLAALRVVHGAAFVALISATTALLVHFVPPRKSGQAFGLFSLTTQLPFALMPPLTEFLLGHVANTAQAYAWMALMILPALGLLIPLGPVARGLAAQARDNARPGLADIGQALNRDGVSRMLGASLLVFLGSTLLFFFMKDVGTRLGLTNAGLFFTVSTGATILVRAGGSALFDRLDKRRTLGTALLLLATCQAAFGLVRTPFAFLAVAAVFGGCMGVALPLVQSLLFLAADPSRRGLTANLMLSTMDAGYALGPWAGGMILAAGLSHAALFGLAAVMSLGACGLIACTSLEHP